MKVVKWKLNKKINVRGLFDFGKIIDGVKNAIKDAKNAFENAIKGEINGPPACPIPTGPIERFKCPDN